MTEFSTSLFIIIHQDMVIAHGFRLEDLWNNFRNYLGSQQHTDKLNKIIAAQGDMINNIVAFSFIIDGKEYYFQRLEKSTGS
ncbi:hypothetical protein RYH73_09765 [Olivibacter sp. CPCC 100613]|uniref:hypothetical protein n=1 Tax=Olivibacter sp. CPCC 100613 TaxID=3079931 RepID=UPI002FF4443D